MNLRTFLIKVKGGPGSGNRGHAGRPGKRGGSSAKSPGGLETVGAQLGTMGWEDVRVGAFNVQARRQHGPGAYTAITVLKNGSANIAPTSETGGSTGALVTIDGPISPSEADTLLGVASATSKPIKPSGDDFQSFDSTDAGKTEAQEFLTSSKGINPTLNEASEESLTDYKEIAFEGINDSLRRGTGSSASERKDISNISSAIDKTSLPQPVVAYRGVGKGVFPASNQTGKRFTDKAFVSTTLDKEFAKDFSAGALVELRLPKGSKALNMEAFNLSALGTSGGQSWVGSEFELLLQKASSFTIISDGKGPGGLREIVMEAIP